MPLPLLRRSKQALPEDEACSSPAAALPRSCTLPVLEDLPIPGQMLAGAAGSLPHDSCALDVWEIYIAVVCKEREGECGHANAVCLLGSLSFDKKLVSS